MRIVFDISGSTKLSGGMRLHASQILATWTNEFPSDQIHVFGPQWVRTIEDADFSIHHWPNESIVHRATGQLLLSAVVARRVKADAVVSLSPIVTPFAGRRTRIAYQHDWRHVKNPHEFPLAQRIYRHLWRASARWADINICISRKTEQETRTLVPDARTILIPNGGDHALQWARQDTIPGRIVTFGHHNNKRPELMIEALPGILLHQPATLIVLGARGDYRENLRQMASRLNVEDNVEFPGFVSDAEYQRLVSSAELVALVSSDEGYGLPVAEALSLGKHALITSDSGIDEIFGSLPFCVNPHPEAITEGVLRALAAPTIESPEVTGWRQTVTRLRAAIIEATASCRPRTRS